MIVKTINPVTGVVSEVEHNEDVVTFQVDAAGQPLGFVQLGSGTVAPAPPEGTGWVWDFDSASWGRRVTLEEAKELALSQIDSAAGAARRRYITDVAGQQAVYLAKAEQAVAHLAGAPAGPYLLAEAEARGTSTADAARLIQTLADSWNTSIGPLIEGTRISGKASVSRVLTLDELEAVRTETVDALSAI